MAINKNFVIKNGAEINTKLFVADSTTQKIGIGTTTPSYDLHVFGAAGNGGIGATFVNVTGITTTQALNVLGVSTFNTGPILVARGELTGTSSQSLQVGTATTVSGVYVSGNIGVGQTLPNAKLEVVPTASGIAGLFSGTTSADLVRITQLGSGNALVIEDSANPDVTSVVVSGLGSVGIGTSFPRFLLDIDTTTSTGTTAVYIRGDVKITGDLSADDLIFDQASLTTLEVVGFSTLGSVSAGNIILAGIATGLNAPGISTFGDTTISDLFLAGITTGLNASGISTLGFIQNTTLNVTGFSTLGSVSAGNIILAGITTGLNAPGISTFGDTTISDLFLAGITTGLNAPGISTFGNTTISDLFLAGITTGLNASGISTLGFIQNTTLNVTGFSTLGSVSAGNIILAGITTGLNAPGISTLGDTTISDLFLAGITTGLNAPGISTFGDTTISDLFLAGITTGLNASGISTLGSIGATNLNVSGVTTSNSYTINGTTIVNSSRQLQNIASLDATTTATIEAAIVNAPNAFTDLSVTGFSTLAAVSAGNVALAGIVTGLNVPGISTLGQTTTVGLSNAGVSTLGNATATTLVVSGVSTLSGGINATQGIDAAGLRVTGITTLGQTNTTGLSNAGVSTLGNATGSTLVVSGFSTFSGGTSATLLNVSGVTTISGGVSASQGAELARLTVTGITTLASATATSVVVGSATTITAGGIDAGSGIVTARQLSQYRALVGATSSATETFTVTVANKTSNHRYFGTGSSQGYFIDGKESPFITLIPGKTYRFDQADSTNSNHPLRFYLDVNKVTQFTNNVTTNGTAGSAGAYTEITIIDATPIVLHYQCSVHGNMGNAVSNYSNFIDTPYQITARSGVSVTGVVTATSFTGDGANLTNTGATLSAGSGAQRVVLTSLTSGVMTTAATDAELSYNSTTDTLSATNLVVSGNISVGGTVTSMDVTNIDSVGIITAQQGLQVLANGINVIGVSTLSGGVNASEGADLARLRVTGISTLGQTNTTGLSNAGVSTLGNATATTLVVSGVTTVGVVTGATSVQATNFYGNGNGLTNLKSSQLTGALPALDGSALTGITVGQIAGSGIVIQEEGTSIGTAGTINFVGLGVTATFSAGFATVSITATGGDVESTWRTYTAGIATAKSVGVNTTNLDDSDLTGIGNSFQGLYIGNGMLIVDNQLNGNHYIGTNFNGLMAGPVTINGTLTIDGNYVVV